MPRPRTGTLVPRIVNGVLCYFAQVWVDHGDDAKREWYSLETADKPTAKRKKAALVRKLAVANPPPIEDRRASAAGAETFKSYAQAWLERRKALGVAMTDTESSILDLHVLPELGPQPLGVIRAADVAAMLDKCVAKGLGRQYLTHIRGVVNRVLQAAWKAELIAENPVAKVEIPETDETVKPREIVTDGEFAALMAYPGDPDVQDHGGLLELKMLALGSRGIGGMRSGDLNAWDWAQIDRVHFASCIVPRRKTRKRRPPQHLEVPEPLRPFLAAWHHRAGKPEAGPVFPVMRGPRKGQAKAGGSSYAKRLRRELGRALDWASIERRRELFAETDYSLPVDFHSFRRAFKTALAEAGVATERAMHLSGSTDPKVHARYVMATKAMRVLPEAAVPRLDVALAAGLAAAPKPRKATRPGTATGLAANSPLILERDTGFEPATLSLGSETTEEFAPQKGAASAPALGAVRQYPQRWASSENEKQQQQQPSLVVALAMLADVMARSPEVAASFLAPRAA